MMGWISALARYRAQKAEARANEQAAMDERSAAYRSEYAKIRHQKRPLSAHEHVAALLLAALITSQKYEKRDILETVEVSRQLAKLLLEERF